MKQRFLFALFILCSLIACSTTTTVVVTATAAPVNTLEAAATPIVIVVTSTPAPTDILPTNTVVPTSYPTQTLYTETPTWRDDTCLNAPTPQLRKGHYALVTTTDGDKLRMRDLPHRSAHIVYAVDPGRYVLIVGGYDCNDGWIWWPVKVDGIQGWASEGTSENGFDEYWLMPGP